MSRLKENIFSLFTLKALEYLVSFITLPYLLRVLGPACYGKILFFQSIIAYGILVTDYGFNITAPRDIAKADAKNLPLEFSSIFLSKILILVVILLILAPITLYFDDNGDTTLFLATLPMLLGAVLFPVWYFQGIQEMRFITIFMFMARTISVILIFTLVDTEADITLAALFLAMPQFLAGVFSLISIFIKSPNIFKVTNLSNIIKKLKDSFEIFLSSIFINLYTNTNMFLLGFIAGDAALGVYGAAAKIIEAVKGVMMPISSGIFPHVSKLVKESKTEAIKFLRKVIKKIGAISFTLSIITFVFADQIVQIIMGAAFTESVMILRIISFLPFIIALSNVFGIQTMVAFQMEKPFSRILMASAILNFILAIPLIYYFSAIGLAVAILIVESFVTVTMYIYLRKKNIRLI